MHSLDILTLAAAIVPNRDATTFDGQRQSYGALASRANRLANTLAGLGIGSGDRVAMVDVNTPAHLEVFFAAMRLDAVYVPLNFRGRADELAYPLKTAQPKATFCGPRYVSMIDELAVHLNDSSLIVFNAKGLSGWSNYEELLATGDEGEVRFPEASDESAATLLFTAGTTGSPKAVPLSHTSFTSFMLTNVEPADPEVEERTLLTLPMYHIAGLQSALASIYGGRTLVVQRQFEALEWMKLVQRERVQRALVVPTMLKQVIDHPNYSKHDLSSLELITYGGAPMPPALIERAVAALPGAAFINAFGQTETGSTIAAVPPEDHVLDGSPEVTAKHRKHLTSIGLPLPDVEVRIVNENDKELGVGETGEIVARGPRLMRSYWGNETSEVETVRDGWLHTGDLGYVDEDGYIYLQGRDKDFIKRGGEMISPEEVENLLHAHAGVDECAVIGLPDETWGERVVAVVVARSGVGVTEKALLELARDQLAGFKRPEQVIFLDILPRNQLGKVLKRDLRESLAN